MAFANCKFCQLLGVFNLKNETDEVHPVVDENSDEFKAHLGTHRLQSRLITKSGPSIGSKKSVKSDKCPEKLEWSEVVAYCKKLLLKQRLKKKLSCAKCGCKLMLFSKKRMDMKTALNHACVHLGKPLFACPHCDKKFKCKASINSHMVTAHKLDRASATYLDLSFGHYRAIMGMVKTCYGQADYRKNPGKPSTQKRQKKGTTQKRRKSHRSISLGQGESLEDCVNTLLRKRSSNRPVQCLECQRLFAKRDDCWSLQFAIINHACLHAGKLLFACKQCDRRYTCRSGIKAHLRLRHSLNGIPDNYVDSTATHHQTIIDWIKRCFGKPKAKPTKTSVRRPQPFRNDHGPLSKFCLEIVLNREHKGTVQCSKCSAILKTRNCGRMKTGMIVGHVYNHLGKSIFACRQPDCDKQFISKSAVKYHLENVHKLTLENNYIDSSGDYQKEITDMIAACFDHPRGPRNDKGQSSKLCRDIILNRELEGTMQCSKCDAILKSRVNGKMITGVITSHAHTHLGKPLFKCGRCRDRFTNKYAVVYHLKNFHQLSSRYVENYVDSSGDFQKEIADMITACFDHPRERPKRLGESKKKTKK